MRKPLKFLSPKDYQEEGSMGGPLPLSPFKKRRKKKLKGLKGLN